MSLVLIKQIPDDYAESVGLAKYGRSRMPGCKDGFQAALADSGRHITGLDDELHTLTDEQAERVKAKREQLEKATGFDLKALSSFWDDFLVEIYADKPKSFDLTNPSDNLSFTMLLANGYVAPTKEDAFTPMYKDTQYYAYREETESEEEISTNKKRDKATGQLLEISDDKDKMLLYGQYLEGIKYSDKFGTDTLFKMLRAYINDKDIKKTENFIKALKLSVEELQQKVIIDKALKQRLINKVSAGGKKSVYQYGQVTLGATLEDVYRNLTLPDFAPELLALKNEVSK